MNKLDHLKAAVFGLGLGAVAAFGFFMSMAPALADEKKNFKHEDAVDLAKGGKMAAFGTDLKGMPSGTPFVSLTPYAIDANGRPFLYISTLAVHTKNVVAKAESSLMVSKEDKENLFNSARITFVGKTKEVTDEEEVSALRKIYYAKYPEAKDFEEFHDFGFYRMEVSRIHYIGGFGDIRWIEGDQWSKRFNQEVQKKEQKAMSLFKPLEVNDLTKEQLAIYDRVSKLPSSTATAVYLLDNIHRKAQFAGKVNINFKVGDNEVKIFGCDIEKDSGRVTMNKEGRHLAIVTVTVKDSTATGLVTVEPKSGEIYGNL